jgi:hypothetical protein
MSLIVSCHHQDLFIRCVIQPFTQFSDHGHPAHAFSIPKLNKKALMYCRIKVMFVADSESFDTILMDEGVSIIECCN